MNTYYEQICNDYTAPRGSDERCKVAVELGRLDLLIQLINDGCKYDKSLCAIAAENDYFNILSFHLILSSN